MSHHSVMKKELVRSIQFLMVSFASAFSNLLYIAVVSQLALAPFWLVSLTSTEFSMLVNFALNDRITFRNLESNRPWYIRLGRFQVAAIGGNLLTAGISTALHDGASFSPLIAQSVAIVATFFVNFAVHRFWTFNGAASRAARPLSGPNAGRSNMPLRPLAGVSGVTVVIPVRNESGSIRPLLLRLHAAMSSLGVPYEAIVIDDHSTDTTVETAKEVIDAERLPMRVQMKRGKPGKSYSLMEGFDEARYSALAMIDGDLELPPEALPGMVSRLGTYDVVIGRRLNYGQNNSLRAQLSAAFNTLVMRLFLGIDLEVQTGVKVFWRHVYESEELHPGQWGFDMEFVARALADGFRIGEYEVPFEKRRAGGTKVNPLVVAAELIVSAVRIKLDLLEAAKVSATLKTRAVQAPGSSAGMPALNAMVPGVLEWLTPLAALVLFLSAVMGPAFFSSTHYFGLPGDTNQYMWYIGWMWRAIGQGQLQLETNAFNYPHPIPIMDYTSVPAIGLLFGWMYPIAGVILPFNLIIMVNYALILVFGKLTLRALGIGQLMSSVGGLLFCLMPYLTAQGAEHLNLAFIAPLFVSGYCFVRIVRSQTRPGWLMGILTGLALTIAFYTFIETTLTLVLCVVIVYTWALVFAFRDTAQLTKRIVNARFLLGLIAPLALTIPGVLNFLQGAGPSPSVRAIVQHDIVASNDLLSLIIPSRFYLAHTQETVHLASVFTGNPIEWDAYLSIPFIILIVVFAIRQWDRPRARILTCAALSLLILSFGPWLRFNGLRTPVDLPWRVLVYLPVLHSALPSRLGLYVFYLAIILVVWGIDDLVNWPSTYKRPVRQKSGLAASLSALALVGVLWMPAIPSFTTTMPQSASILRSAEVVARYIQRQPTLVLYDQYQAGADNLGFNVVMGILAASNSYGLVTSNNYGIGDRNASFQVNQAFVSDAHGTQTVMALRQYLPQIGVARVMYISIDNQPIAAPKLQEISAFLGAPVFDGQRLVVVWDAPSAARVSPTLTLRWSGVTPVVDAAVSAQPIATSPTDRARSADTARRPAPGPPPADSASPARP